MGSDSCPSIHVLLLKYWTRKEPYSKYILEGCCTGFNYIGLIIFSHWTLENLLFIYISQSIKWTQASSHSVPMHDLSKGQHNKQSYCLTKCVSTLLHNRPNLRGHRIPSTRLEMCSALAVVMTKTNQSALHAGLPRSAAHTHSTLPPTCTPLCHHVSFLWSHFIVVTTCHSYEAEGVWGCFLTCAIWDSISVVIKSLESWFSFTGGFICKLYK